jgi:hypothetical protein
MNHFSLALLGDGAFGRFGPECPELLAELGRLYTHSTFDILNAGVEDSRMGHVLWRITTDSEAHKSISYHNPDIVVIESCALSQFWDGPEGLSEYRDLMRRVWDELDKTTTAKKLICLTAPPPRDRFLDGVPRFNNTSKATRGRFADAVKMFVDEARAIAEDEGWPVVDAAAEVDRRIKNGENARRFFDQNDGVYPSRLGYTALAKVLVRVLDNQRFIEERITK